MKLFLVIIILTSNFCSLLFGKSLIKFEEKPSRKVFNVSVDNNCFEIYMKAHKSFGAFVVVTEPYNLNLLLTKLSTVVLPLNISFIDDKRYIKLLKSAEKVLLIPSDDDLSLNDTENFLRNFWQKHKSGRIFVFNQSIIYYYNPFIFDFDTKEFGKLRVNTQEAEEGRKSLQKYPFRIEHFYGTYSEPVQRNNLSAAFQGPDIDITRLVLDKMNIKGKQD